MELSEAETDRQRQAASSVDNSTGWQELRVVADSITQEQLLIEALLPFVFKKRFKPGTQILFLRERVDKARLLRVWLRHGAADELAWLIESFGNVTREHASSIELSTLPGSSLNVSALYDGPQARILSDMLADATPLLLELLAKIGLEKRSRIGLALDLMVGHLVAIDIARAFPERYPLAKKARGFPSAFAVYRSHADGLLVMSADPATARAKLDREYRRVAHSIRQRTQVVLAQFADGPLVSEAASRWHDLASGYLRRAEAALRAGTLQIKWEAGYLGDAYDLTISPFHQVVQDARRLRQLVQNDFAYQAVRIAMSGLYLALSNLGIELADRSFLCHAVATACEELFGLNATSVVQELTYALAADDDRRP